MPWGFPCAWSEALRIGFLGYLFNFAPLGIVGGDLLKAWLLARIQHGRRAEAVATVIVDRLVGLYLLFVVATAAILLTGFWRIPETFVEWTCKITFATTALSTLGVIALLLPDFSHGRSTRWVAKVPKVGPPLLAADRGGADVSPSPAGTRRGLVDERRRAQLFHAGDLSDCQGPLCRHAGPGGTFRAQPGERGHGRASPC